STAATYSANPSGVLACAANRGSAGNPAASASARANATVRAVELDNPDAGGIRLERRISTPVRSGPKSRAMRRATAATYVLQRTVVGAASAESGTVTISRDPRWRTRSTGAVIARALARIAKPTAHVSDRPPP